ncbi:keratin-associated protein family [Trichomonas vaginalis G3]|uniref:keratin-associated protein family n=1 Tax=Trichomonas vaginalis (strain ATCC PRA-98 / G3) TaxID=412133 RepID=UPI0021E53FF6|nr:keratin-associated protein family [Trichomonas vaginalis G3]KAI5543691.1 keratin-associated protein family [Trichomonas vaginalis G3]
MNKVLKSHNHNISDINELQTTLDSKADKNHTHKSFTTVRADDIILNYTLGSSTPSENPSTSVKDTLNNLDNYCRNIDQYARNFEAYTLPTMLDKKADKNHTHEEFQTIKIKEIKACIEIVTKTGRNGATVQEQRIYPPTFPNGLITNNINIVEGNKAINVKHELLTMKAQILQTIYPVGSIYTSMNSTNPATVLGFGTWKQIVDKFLYCAKYSKQTGGSKKIKEANLPAHTHTGTTNFSGDHSHSLRDHPLYNSEYEAGHDVLSPSYNNAAKKIF